MTPEDILQMPAGKPLNDLFCIHVMGWKIPNAIFDPSRRLGDAWMGLERFQSTEDGRMDQVDGYLTGIAPLYAMKESEAALSITRALVIVGLMNEEEE